jgi:hypothetical protein
MARRHTGHGLPWAILECHYVSRAAFLAIYKAYEGRVLRLVEERGIAREKLKLDPTETRDLFDTWRLNELIEKNLFSLREVSHAFFREQDVPEPYDSKVSRIYHELSILKEEHLSVRDFPRGGGGSREFARLFREVSEYYPQRLRRVRDLFARATQRLEELLPRFCADTIVLRSAFLFRNDLWPDNARIGLARFLGKMFPAEGVAHGFHQVARSFFKAAFFDHAIESARMGVRSAAKKAQARSARGQEARELTAELDRLIARAGAELKALEEEAL